MNLRGQHGSCDLLVGIGRQDSANVDFWFAAVSDLAIDEDFFCFGEFGGGVNKLVYFLTAQVVRQLVSLDFRVGGDLLAHDCLECGWQLDSVLDIESVLDDGVL